MAHKSRTEYSTLNILTGVGGYVINTLMGFICRMVFVRCLSNSYLGINGLLSNFLSMLTLTELGIGSAIIFALYKPVAENDEAKIAALMRVYKYAYWLIGTVVAVLGVCMVPFLEFVIGDAPQIKENFYLIYGIYLFNTTSSYFFTYYSSLINAHQRSYIVVGVSYIITTLQSIVQIILLLCFRSYLPYLIVQTIGTQAYNVMIALKARRDYPYLKRKDVPPLPKAEMRGLFQNVKSVMFYKLSSVLVNHTDNLVITYFSGLGISGLASNYTLLVTTLTTLVNQVFNSITASIGNLNASEDVEHQYAFFKVLNLANFWVYAWAALGVAFVSTDLVHLLFGASYVMDWYIPVMLAVNLYMVGMQNAIWTYKNTKGLFKYGQYLLLVTAALNVAGDIVLGAHLGVFGIYLATAIARGLTNSWYEPYAVFKVAFGRNPVIYLKQYLFYLLLLLSAGAGCWVVCGMIRFSPLINAVVKAVICSVIPNGLFFLVFRREEEFAQIRQIALRVLSLAKKKLLH